MIDYKELLKKYMTHVIECEGCSFVPHHTNGVAWSDVVFNQEEVDHLEKLSEEY